MEAVLRDLMQKELPIEVNEIAIARSRVRPRNAGLTRQDRKLSSTERSSSGFEYAQAQLAARTITCGECQQLGHNRRTCPRLSSLRTVAIVSSGENSTYTRIEVDPVQMAIFQGRRRLIVEDGAADEISAEEQERRDLQRPINQDLAAALIASTEERTIRVGDLIFSICSKEVCSSTVFKDMHLMKHSYIQSIRNG